MSSTLTRPAVKIARQPRARAGLALTLAVLALPGVSIAWALPAGGLWIGVPLAVTALTLGIRARREQPASTARATAAIVISAIAPRLHPSMRPVLRVIKTPSTSPGRALDQHSLPCPLSDIFQPHLPSEDTEMTKLTTARRRRNASDHHPRSPHANRGRRGHSAVRALALALTAALAPTMAVAAASLQDRETIAVTDHAIKLPQDGLHSGINSIRVLPSGREVHHLVFWRLKSGVSYARFDAVLQSNTGNPEQVSSIEGGNGPVTPGTPVDLYLVLPAGKYAITDLVHGNVTTELHTTVTRQGTNQTAPSSLGAVDARRGTDRYRLPRGFGSPGVYEFRNMDRETHEVSVVRLAPGKSVQDLIKWAKHPAGAPPAIPLGGFGALHGQGHGWFVLPRLPHGHYALACFFPNAMGVPHVAMGMAAGFTR